MTTAVCEAARLKTPQWIIAVLCSLLVIAMAPKALFFPFTEWSIAGTLLLIYSASQRSDVRLNLLNIAAWLPACALLSSCVLFGLSFLSSRTIDASLDLGVGRAFYS